MFYLCWGIFCDFLQKLVLNARTQFLTKRFIFVFLAIFSTKSRWTLAFSTKANIMAGTDLFCSGISASCLMSGSCHFNRASNDKFSVEFWIFVIVMFLTTADFWNLGHLQGTGSPPSTLFFETLTKLCKQKTVLLEEWFSTKTPKWDSQNFQSPLL